MSLKNGCLRLRGGENAQCRPNHARARPSHSAAPPLPPRNAATYRNAAAEHDDATRLVQNFNVRGLVARRDLTRRRRRGGARAACFVGRITNASRTLTNQNTLTN